jgi:hypothetical protein
MKLTLTLLTLAAIALAAPVPQGSYDTYGEFFNIQIMLGFPPSLPRVND